MKSSSRWQAPQDDGAWLIDPPVHRFREILELNKRRFQRADTLIAGSPLKIWRFLARRQLAPLIDQTFRRWREPVPHFDPERPIIAAGHQPDLFHPGVWAKNFFIRRQADQLSLNAVNFIVDSDTMKSATIGLPDGAVSADPNAVRWQTLAFDAAAPESPYELRSIVDQNEFRSFGMRIEQTTADWPYRPMAVDFWPEVVERLATSSNVGELMAMGRRGVERRWGCQNIELPLSQIAQTRLFATFASALLADLPRLHTVYNLCVQAHRRTFGIRSRHHPVPDLATDGDWLESPFWAWRSGSMKRGPLFARVQPGDDCIALRIGAEEVDAIRIPRRDGSPIWDEVGGLPFPIRPRALITTMFIRLFLADVFVHGIGGGNYDRLTDDIIRRYFGVEPPEYMVVSATLRLPLPTFPATIDDRRRLHRQLRDLDWKPDQFVEADPLTAERRRLNSVQPATSAARKDRYRSIRRILVQLRPRVLEHRIIGVQQLRRIDRELHANAIRRRRDYAFCLFPAQMLQQFLTDLA